MMIKTHLYIILLICALLYSCSTKMPEKVKKAYQEIPYELVFNQDIKPILSDKCFACHGPDNGKIKGGLQLHSFEAATAELKESKGKFAVQPGDPNNSEMIKRILSEDPSQVMPTPESHLSLSDYEKAVLIKWVEEGAKYEPHWAFTPVSKPENIHSNNSKWERNFIDYYITKKLNEKGLSPSKEANKQLLLRRLSLDLTGLPPTTEEIEYFLNDSSENAYEKQVDRLLTSPHYGEKMATDWMDVARYADTHGYQIDRLRDMSPWRDWVIKAFNSNKPYDEFITEQLAGDLLKEATKEQILATGFNRLHPQNAEGGIVDEEFRVEYVADRTAVLGQGIMGMTIACARCHDHKYDPISQKNYYELFSFFNNINETGQISWDAGDMPVPTMLLPNEEQEEIISFLKSVCDSSLLEKQTITKEEIKPASQWIKDEKYQGISQGSINHQKVAEFQLNNSLINTLNGKVGKMDRQFSKKEIPNFTNGKYNKGLLLDGDAWIDLAPIGIYDRHDPFSISLWIKIPQNFKEGVLFHKNKAVMLHSMKGYTLYVKDEKLQVIMAHTYPENAIIKTSKNKVPKDEWIHITLTNDGTSKAKGVQLYVNGLQQVMNVEQDNLFKSIIFNNYEDIIYSSPIEPGLQIGARWRGLGAKGCSVDQIEVFSRDITQLEILQLSDLKKWKQLICKKSSLLSKEERKVLQQYYLQRKSIKFNQVNKKFLAKQKQFNQTKDTLPEVMVMKEMDEPRQAYILERGVYDNYGEKVYPNTPSSILEFPDEYPRNRLGLAQWLTHPKHPLTARVAVNRYWQNFFGKGIVETTEDFGNQGKLPTHPKLLNHLAYSFMQNNWDVKSLHKTMVMSSTYRQSSIGNQMLKEKDPNNDWLARGPQFRLTSEMMRDNALAASGLINTKIGGKSVFPYQPDGLWSMNANKYEQSTGNDLYRRSLYTVWKRTVPNPTQSTFDQPDRSECTVRRQKTNTPLQALVLLNDPTFIEISRKLGEEISNHITLDDGISKVYLKLTGKNISSTELTLLKEVHQKEKLRFSNNPDKMKGWLSSGQYQISKDAEAPTVIANAIIASIILNSDATITRR